MSIEVLKTDSQIEEARAELRRKKLSCLDPEPWWRRIARPGSDRGRAVIGDVRKSWDVLKTARFIERNLGRHDPVLDLGAYESEILCVLYRLGYRNLAGVDLNPGIKEMPYARRIRYEIGNFFQTPFDDASFAAVTAISVIEHGFDASALLTEVSRLLRPGGYFIASFDYWPEKLDTSGIRVFGMDWRVFSENEVNTFLREAATYGLSPCGPIDLEARDAAINWSERNYTFAWMALRKGGRDRPVSRVR